MPTPTEKRKSIAPINLADITVLEDVTEEFPELREIDLGAVDVCCGRSYAVPTVSVDFDGTIQDD